MLGLKSARNLIATGLSVGILLTASHLAFADQMSSTNYKIQADVMSVGGNHSTSTNFVADDTVGDLATGEDLTSTNFKGCSGYQCFQTTPYLNFSVTAGLTAPGAAGVPVTLGTLSTSAVTTSNGTSINSIFVTAESNGSGGSVITVKDTNAGLKRLSTADTVVSSTATLTAGNPGLGVCVFSNTQHAESPTAFNKVAPYASTCDKTTGHSVGGLTTTPQTILQSSGALKGGAAEILVKSSISSTNAAGNDYSDTLTFIITSTY